MIEILSSQNGGSIVRQRGRLLASRFDPHAEAEAWLAKRLAFLDKVKGIFVLGLGSGYHVKALELKTQAKIVVIERHQDLIEAVAGIHSVDTSRVRIESLANARSLRSTPSVRDLVRSSFVVLTHPASVAQEPEFYRDCATQLIGREWGALTWQWSLKDLPDLDSTPRVTGAQAQPLTIYDLAQTELVQDSDERERLLIQALRELVK